MARQLVAVPEFASVGIKLSVTENQKHMIRRIRNNTLTFVCGPAGTGKTYIAIAEGIRALLDSKNKRTQRFFFVRPAVASHEDLGYLPGDLDEKTEPYMAPFHYSLKKLLNGSSGKASGKVETMTMAFMRGMTLENCYVVLDEAQNTNVDQMKLFLSRIGRGCKVVVVGDTKQTDIDVANGLADGVSRFRSVPGIAVHHLTHKDNMRSPIVEKILRLYEGATLEEIYPELEFDPEYQAEKLKKEKLDDPVTWGDGDY